MTSKLKPKVHNLFFTRSLKAQIYSVLFGENLIFQTMNYEIQAMPEPFCGTPFCKALLFISWSATVTTAAARHLKMCNFNAPHRPKRFGQVAKTRNTRLGRRLGRPYYNGLHHYGRLLCEEALGLSMNEVSMGELPPGLYFWKIHSGGLRARSGRR